MQITLVKYYVKGILRNRHIWFWGVAFMFFWLLLGVFELSQGIPDTPEAHTAVASSWYGLLSLFSLSSIAISIAYTIYYSSSSLTYSFKYTKLTPTGYIATLIGASSILGAALSAIILVSTSGLFSAHFNTSLLPGNVAGAIAVSALTGVFMMSFAIMLVLLSVNYLGLRSVNLIMFVPMILAFWLGDTQMYSSMPLAAVYASPYNAIQSLLYLSFNGTNVYAQLYDATTPALQWPFLLASLLSWIVVLIAVDVYLLRHMKPRQTEEARQI